VVGRAGTIRLSISADAIHVGGHAVSCVEGSLVIA
jgi:predicted PhzF superfamily epimerase YddE/YHI9